MHYIFEKEVYKVLFVFVSNHLYSESGTYLVIDKTIQSLRWSYYSPAGYIQIVSLLYLGPIIKFNFWFLLTENRRASVDVFLKAAGYLDCAVRHVLPQLPAELRFVQILSHYIIIISTHSFNVLSLFYYWLWLQEKFTCRPSRRGSSSTLFTNTRAGIDMFHLYGPKEWIAVAFVHSTCSKLEDTLPKIKDQNLLLYMIFNDKMSNNVSQCLTVRNLYPNQSCAFSQHRFGSWYDIKAFMTKWLLICATPILLIKCTQVLCPTLNMSQKYVKTIPVLLAV